MFYERLRFHNPISVVTSDGTITNVVVVSLPSLPGWTGGNVGLHVEGVLVGRDSSGNFVSTRVARAVKMQAGTLSALGTQASAIGVGIGDAALAAIVATLDVSGTDLRLRATGVIATSIGWRGFIEIWSGDL